MPRRRLSHPHRTRRAATRSRKLHREGPPAAFDSFLSSLSSSSVAVAWISRIPVAASYSCTVDTCIHILRRSCPLFSASCPAYLRVIGNPCFASQSPQGSPLSTTMLPSPRATPLEPTQVKGERESLIRYISPWQTSYTTSSPSKYQLTCTAWKQCTTGGVSHLPSQTTQRHIYPQEPYHHHSLLHRHLQSLH